ncbi:MAG: hypothetical protein ACOC4C_03320 [Fibrobacterota bacterium]
MDRSLESGFSIVEIFIVIIIISTSAIIITRSLKNSVGMHRDAYVSEMAFKEAEEKLVELNANPFPSNDSDQVTTDHIVFYRNWVIDTSGCVNTAEISVQWAHTGNRRQITLMGAVR